MADKTQERKPPSSNEACIEVANDASDLGFKLERLSGKRLDGLDQAALVEGLAELDHAPGFETPHEYIDERDAAIAEGRRALLTPDEFLEGGSYTNEAVLELTQQQEVRQQRREDLQQFLLEAGQAVYLSEVNSPDVSHEEGLEFDGVFSFKEAPKISKEGEVSGEAYFTGYIIHADGSRSRFTNIKLQIDSSRLKLPAAA